MFARFLSRRLLPLVIFTWLTSAGLGQQPPMLPTKQAIVHKIQSPTERLVMTVHTSRIVTMDQKIPQAQVNNPDILDLTPLSPYQIQVSAKTAGVTQINLWGENQKLFTIDVIVYGDAEALKLLLRSQFPNAALNIVPVASSVLISGYVDKLEHIDRIVRIAEEYYPKVINNMTVGGVQTVLLHVRVMEVSRTKLARVGFRLGPDYRRQPGDLGHKWADLAADVAGVAVRRDRHRHPRPRPPSAITPSVPRPSPSTSPRARARFSGCWTPCGKTTC